MRIFVIFIVLMMVLTTMGNHPWEKEERKKPKK